jgi:predicted PurR-regulated permease PerM
LFRRGTEDWGTFMVVWTLLVAFGDNVIRPGPIGFGVAMPLSLVILGVFGGFLSFGFLGLFIGPTPLGVGLALLKAWRETAPPL